MQTGSSAPKETTVGNYFVANYPPFSCWSPEQCRKLEKVLSWPVPDTTPISLYLHIPFCRQRCHYCYFRVYPRRSPEDVNLYIDKVLEEVALYLQQPAVAERPWRAVYFGGGSPSYLSAAQLERLLSGMQAHQNWRDVAEFTFECDPVTTTLEKLRLLKSAGVTRLSLGFQTLDDTILRQNGRDVCAADCLRAYDQAREVGFDQINIDLIAGLLGERTRTWRKTISRTVQLAPDCVTIYKLELTHNSTLHQSIEAGRSLQLPTWQAKRAWLADAFDILEHVGYSVVSGYMAVRDPRRWHFSYTMDGFWHGEDLLGVGETAFGHIQGVHYQNADTFQRYITLLQEEQLPWRRAYALNEEEKLRREVILLLKTGSLDARYFRRKYGVELALHFGSELEELCKRELVTIEGDCVRLTREALLDVDWLLPLFYLPHHRGVRYT